MSKKSVPKKICIICEGDEEYDYIERLCHCEVWDISYTIKLKNAKGLNRIAPIYQNLFQNDCYDIILIFCDTENEPYEQFKSLTDKINRMHGQKNIANQIIIFANPCTMQIILSHFGSVNLSCSSKNKNATKIKQLTGVEEYRATESQRASIMKKIDNGNYSNMKTNINKISTDCKQIPSTNFLWLIHNLESADTKWVSTLSKKIIGND